LGVLERKLSVKREASSFNPQKTATLDFNKTKGKEQYNAVSSVLKPIQRLSNFNESTR
jgi:hypothetical protein